jgi:hypothetical protein
MSMCASVTVLSLTSITDGISRTSACRRSVRSNLLSLNTTLVFLDPYVYNVRHSSTFSSTDCEAAASLQDRNEIERPSDRSPLNREKDRQTTAGSLIIGSVPFKGVTRPICNYKTPYLPFWPLHKLDSSVLYYHNA